MRLQQSRHAIRFVSSNSLRNSHNLPNNAPKPYSSLHSATEKLACSWKLEWLALYSPDEDSASDKYGSCPRNTLAGMASDRVRRNTQISKQHCHQAAFANNLREIYPPHNHMPGQVSHSPQSSSKCVFSSCNPSQPSYQLIDNLLQLPYLWCEFQICSRYSFIRARTGARQWYIFR